jgi:hypothetical protein
VKKKRAVALIGALCVLLQAVSTAVWGAPSEVGGSQCEQSELRRGPESSAVVASPPSAWAARTRREKPL